MQSQTAPEVHDFVLRALAASEIAESCSQPAIKQSFVSLTARWLAEAERAGEQARRARPPQSS
ncbi:hypothetical protein [Phenylobacterium sp.]|jgi:hypothetical protein|uniref:hypothetical protein n=1 Tax=Phenylobacterium sp. TaxID=1871053 RepID=UPI002F92CD75